MAQLYYKCLLEALAQTRFGLQTAVNLCVYTVDTSHTTTCRSSAVGDSAEVTTPDTLTAKSPVKFLAAD